MFFVGIGIGYIPLKPGVGIVGNRSIAISAACHPTLTKDNDTKAVAYEKVSWGVVSPDSTGVHRCAFSSGEVRPMQVGVEYKG